MPHGKQIKGGFIGLPIAPPYVADLTGSNSQQSLNSSAWFLGTFEIRKDFIKKSVELNYGKKRLYKTPENLEIKLFLV